MGIARGTDTLSAPAKRDRERMTLEGCGAETRAPAFLEPQLAEATERDPAPSARWMGVAGAGGSGVIRCSQSP